MRVIPCKGHKCQNWLFWLHIQSSNLEINPNALLTHVFDPTLVKLNTHVACFISNHVDWKTFFIESTWKTFVNQDSQWSISFLFLDQYPRILSLLNPFFRENIFPHVMTFLGHLSGHKYPAIGFHEWKHVKLLVWENLANIQQ